MKQSINLYQFRQAFYDMDRRDQFTYEGLEVIFDALEDCAADTGDEFELDVVAICCDFYEAEPDDIASDYSIPLDEDLEDDERREAVLDYLSENTWVLGETDSTIIYQAF